MSEVPITPETRVAQLLDAYPQLEDVLVAQAPAFERLKNPILRRTVARLTTLERAAGIAGLDVRTLVQRLREAAGLPVEPETAAESAAVSTGAAPAWFTGRTPTEHIDAEALLDSGETPLPKVMEAARALAADGLLEVTAAFKPLPMVDALEHQGFRTHIEPLDGGRYGLYVVR
ncbi:MAG: DUF1858 domain-containing protein [Planctomycetota bacterium]